MNEKILTDLQDRGGILVWEPTPDPGSVNTLYLISQANLLEP